MPPVRVSMKLLAAAVLAGAALTTPQPMAAGALAGCHQACVTSADCINPSCPICSDFPPARARRPVCWPPGVDPGPIEP